MLANCIVRIILYVPDLPTVAAFFVASGAIR
jgi:hypothetical protein